MSFRKVILLIFCYLTNAYAVEVKVPLFLAGVSSDPKAKKGEFYVYKVEGKFEPTIITPKKTSNLSIEELVSSMFYAYETNDREFFLTLLSKEAAQKIKSMPKAQFDEMWISNASKKNLHIQFYHEFNNGMLIGLSGPSDKIPQLHFARKIGKSWFFDKLVINDEDPKTNNIGLWVSFLPMKSNKANLLRTFSRKDKFNILEAQVSEPFLAILVRGKDRWQYLGQVKDNDETYSSWPDLSKAKGIIKIDVDSLKPDDQRENLEILVIESSYPLSYYPFSEENSGQFTY